MAPATATTPATAHMLANPPAKASFRNMIANAANMRVNMLLAPLGPIQGHVKDCTKQTDCQHGDKKLRSGQAHVGEGVASKDSKQDNEH